MDFELTEEQSLLQTAVREFAAGGPAPARGADRPVGRVPEGPLPQGRRARSGRRLRVSRARRGRHGRRVLRARHRGDLARLRQHRRHPLGEQLARLRPDREVGKRGAEEEVPGAAGARREARLLRPDRARRRLGRRQPEDPRRPGRGRLSDHRPEGLHHVRREGGPLHPLRDDVAGEEGARHLRFHRGRRHARGSTVRATRSSSASTPPAPSRSS